MPGIQRRGSAKSFAARHLLDGRLKRWERPIYLLDRFWTLSEKYQMKIGKLRCFLLN
jgi:hypothetical protein